MGLGHDIGTYYQWAVLIPVSMGIMVVAVAMLPLILVYFIDKCSCTHFTSFFFVYSKLVFRDAVKKKKNPPRILFHGYEISNWAMVQIATVISVFVFCVFISFWSSFVLGSSYACDPTLDCFLRNSTLWINGKMPQKIDDCKKVNKTVSVICYQFELNAPKGFSSSVGFLAVSVMYIYVYGALLVWLMEIALSPVVTSIPAKICSIMGWSLLIIFPFGVAVAATVVMYSDKILAEVTFKNFESELIFVTYLVFFVYAGPVSAVITSLVLFKSIRSQMQRDHYESNSDLRIKFDLNEQENVDKSSSKSNKPLLQSRGSSYESTTA